LLSRLAGILLVDLVFRLANGGGLGPVVVGAWDSRFQGRRIKVDATKGPEGGFCGQAAYSGGSKQARRSISKAEGGNISPGRDCAARM
jgi:hypothetical protein